MKPSLSFIVHHAPGAALLLALFAGAPTAALASAVCVSAPYIENGVAAQGCISSDYGYSGGSHVVQTGPWGLAVSVAGEYRGGSFSSTQAVDLSTGVLRSNLRYASGLDDPGEYQLGNYLDMSDGITFAGSGSAVFSMRLTGAFLGSAHGLYPNTMDTALDLYSDTRRDDVLGRINLAHMSSGLANFTPGSTCGRISSIGRVECELHSMVADQIDITMRVYVDNITDGETFDFRSTLNTQAYGPRGGGSDFGNTARLSVTLSDGLSFGSDSGVLLAATSTGTPTNPVPEPASLLLAVLGLLVLAAQRQRLIV